MENHNKEFNTKLLKALNILQKKNIKESSYSPLMYQLYWKLGIQLPPPHFLGFVGNMLVSGLPIAISMVGLYMMVNESSSKSIYQMLVEVLIIAVTAIAIWGSTIATYYKFDSKKYKLPRWSAI